LLHANFPEYDVIYLGHVAGQNKSDKRFFFAITQFSLS
jgi:hypothetical protein